MYLCGIDIGIRNLALCVIKYDNNDKWSIKKWFIIDILMDTNYKSTKNMSIYILIKLLINQLQKNKKYFIKLDKIYIEKQPRKNKYMEFITIALETYFLSNDKEVFIIPPQKKFIHILGTKYDINKNKTYNDRKKYGFDIVADILIKYNMVSRIEFINSVKKADDLTDSLLICFKAIGFHLY